jgi:3'-5' exoribonuclease
MLLCEGTCCGGSPVLPRTPEAFALHYIDNLDAKLEMVREAYGHSQEIAPGIFDRVFPLPTNLIRPLASFTPPPPTEVSDPPCIPEQVPGAESREPEAEHA